MTSANNNTHINKGLSIKSVKTIAVTFLMLATIIIYAIAQAIELGLEKYDVSSLYISFCVGFILFTPLVSLVLHPFANRIDEIQSRSYFSTVLANFGLVSFVQFLFFLIWITDAVAVYSIYVDQSSFLSQAFNINGKTNGEYSQLFLYFNVFLGWFFALLSIVVGLLPCLVARIYNEGVIGNFVKSFNYAKQHKLLCCLYAILISLSVILPLLTMPVTFIVIFPSVLFIMFKRLVNDI